MSDKEDGPVISLTGGIPYGMDHQSREKPTEGQFGVETPDTVSSNVSNQAGSVLNAHGSVDDFKSFLLEGRVEEGFEGIEFLLSGVPIREKHYKRNLSRGINGSIRVSVQNCIADSQRDRLIKNYSIGSQLQAICSRKYTGSRAKKKVDVDHDKFNDNVNEINEFFKAFVEAIRETAYLKQDTDSIVKLSELTDKHREMTGSDAFIPVFGEESIIALHKLLDGDTLPALLSDEVQRFLASYIMIQNASTHFSNIGGGIDIKDAEARKVINCCEYIATTKFDKESILGVIYTKAISDFCGIQIDEDQLKLLHQSTFARRVLGLYRYNKPKSSEKGNKSLFPAGLGQSTEFRVFITRLYVMSKTFRNTFDKNDDGVLFFILLQQWYKGPLSGERRQGIESFMIRVDTLPSCNINFISHVLLLGIEDIDYILSLTADEETFISEAFIKKREENGTKYIDIIHDRGFLRHIDAPSLKILARIQTPQLIGTLASNPQDATAIISNEDKYEQMQYVHQSYEGAVQMRERLKAGQTNPAGIGAAEETKQAWDKGGFAAVASFHRDTLGITAGETSQLNELYLYFAETGSNKRRDLLIEFFEADETEQEKMTGFLGVLGSHRIYDDIPSMGAAILLIDSLGEGAWETDRETLIGLLEIEFQGAEGEGPAYPEEDPNHEDREDTETSLEEKLIHIFGEEILKIIALHEFSENICLALLGFEEISENFKGAFLEFLKSEQATVFFQEHSSQESEELIMNKLDYIISLLKLFESNDIFSVEKNNKLFEFCFKRGDELDIELIGDYLSYIHTSTVEQSSYIIPVMRFLKTGSILYLKNDSALTIQSIADVSKHKEAEKLEKATSMLSTFFKGIHTAFDQIGTDHEYSYLIEGLSIKKGEEYNDYIQCIISLDSTTIESMLGGNDSHSFMGYFKEKLNGSRAISCIEYIEIIRDWISESHSHTMVEFDESYYQLQSQLRKELASISTSQEQGQTRKKRRKSPMPPEETGDTSYIGELSPRQHAILKQLSRSRSENIGSLITSALNTKSPDHKMVYYKLLYSSLKTGHRWGGEEIEKLSTMISGSTGNITPHAVANASYGLQAVEDITMIPDRLLHTILTDINGKYKNFSDQQLVNTLMGLSDFKENSQVQATASKLFGEIKERGLKNLDPSSPHYPLDIRYIVAIYNLYGRDDIPSDIYNEYQRVIKLTSKISHSEKVCLSHVREKFENAESGVHIDGFELDILIGKKLNIEIDGGHHKDQSHYDKKRDTYLLGKYGIRTERYVLCEATIEKEIISFKKWFRQLLEEIRAEADKN